MIGSGDNRFRVGDHVFGRAGGPAAGPGTYCDYVCVPQDSAIALVPRGLHPRAAAALPSAGTAAAQILEAVALRGHETLLVVGAAGGVGSFLTQLAAARDVRVIAAVRGDERSRMGSLGAAATLDVTAGPVAEAIRAACPDGVDALADLASATPAAFAAHAAAVRPGGIALSTLGVAAGAPLTGGVRGIDFRLDPNPALLEVLAAVPRRASCASSSTSNSPGEGPAGPRPQPDRRGARQDRHRAAGERPLLRTAPAGHRGDRRAAALRTCEQARLHTLEVRPADGPQEIAADR